MPATLGQRPTTRDWLDDGDDCLANAISTCLQLQGDVTGSWIPAIEAAYLELHPMWDNRASTIELADYWRALYSLNIWPVALHHLGDLVDEIAGQLAIGNVPMVWLYLEDSVTGGTYHHAVCCYDYSAGALRLWDPQVGRVREVTPEQFLSSSGPIRTSGYAYALSLLPF